MAGVGALVAVLLYFGFAIGLAGSALTRLDEQDPPPGASPWRLRAPRLTLWAAPVLFNLSPLRPWLW